MIEGCSRGGMTRPKSVHPGAILPAELLIPMGIRQNALARAIRVAPRRIDEIVLDKRDITADTGLRLSRAFGASEGFGMGLQADYDRQQARKLISL